MPLNTTERPGGRHRAHDRLVVVEAVGRLLAPAHDDQQRVVDRDAEADQRDQELDDRRHAGDRGDPPHDQERGHDRDDRHQDRDERQQRPEHEREHDQRAEAAEQRLEEHAGPVALAALLGRQRVEPGHVDRLAGDPHVAHRRVEVLARVGVAAERLVWVGRRVDDREHGPPVVRHERAAAGARVRGDRERPARPSLTARRSGPAVS